MRKRRRRRIESTDDAEVSSLEALRQEEMVIAAAEAPLGWAGVLVVLLPVIVCFLGNGRNPWVTGGAAIATGLLAILNPVQKKMPWSMLLLSFGILSLGLITLLPLPLPFVPAWRQALISDLAMPLASSWSPQPRVTLENGAWLMVVLLWFNWGAGYWQSSGSRSQALRVLAGGLVALAVTSLTFHALRWEPSTWRFSKYEDIGPFANRNHFGCLMAMTTVLCLTCAYDLLRRRKRSWVLFGLGIVPCFAAVLITGSRAGLLLFGMSVVLWLSVSAMRKRSLQRLAVSGAVVLALTAGLVLFGQKVLHRFSSQGSVVENIMEEGRWPIHAAALDLILQNPLLGVGLGNFAAVFGMTNTLGEGFVRFRHPESDWLWFMAEAGWPATLGLIAGVLLMVLWTGPWRTGAKSSQRRERRLRLSCGIALLLAVVHGMVDVPNHDLPMALLVTLLAAMSLSPDKLAKASGAVVPNLFRAAGLLALAAGSLWFATGMGTTTLMGQSALTKNLQEAKDQSTAGDAARAWKAASRATEAAPLNWEAWFARGEIGLKLGRPSAEVLLDFARSRYLEPNVADNCMVEARHWLHRDPMMAVPVWREALRREASLQSDRYREMVITSETLPELRTAVRDLASNQRLLLQFLNFARGAEAESVLQEMLQRYPALEGLNSAERKLLFEFWYRINRQTLAEALQKHEGWLADGWYYLATDYASKNDFKRAFELAQRYVISAVNLPSEALASIEQLQREFSLYPSDAKRGFNLYVAQRDQKKYDDALKTLQTMAGQPTAPKSVYFEMGKMYGHKGDFEKAWEMIVRFLHA